MPVIVAGGEERAGSGCKEEEGADADAASESAAAIEVRLI